MTCRQTSPKEEVPFAAWYFHLMTPDFCLVSSKLDAFKITEDVIKICIPLVVQAVPWVWQFSHLKWSCVGSVLVQLGAGRGGACQRCWGQRGRCLSWQKCGKPEFLHKVVEGVLVILVYSLPPSPFNRHVSEALRRALLKNLNRNRWGYAPEGSDTTIFSSTIMYFSWLFQLVSFVHDCIAPDLQRFKLLTTATPQENKNPRQGFS